MTRHFNPSIVNRAQRILNSKGTDTIGDEISGPFAIVDINVPKNNIIGTLTKVNTGGATVVAVSTSKDTYITGFSLSFSKNATCDVATGAVSLAFTIDGQTQTHGTLAITTLVEELNSVYVQLYPAMRIDRGSNISLSTNSFTAGAMSRTATVYGYTEETTSS